jgi:hypothetical protein
MLTHPSVPGCQHLLALQTPETRAKCALITISELVPPEARNFSFRKMHRCIAVYIFREKAFV